MVVRWPVPIVLSRGAIVPLGVFALIFVAFSGTSKPSVLAAAQQGRAFASPQALETAEKVLSNSVQR